MLTKQWPDEALRAGEEASRGVALTPLQLLAAVGEAVVVVDENLAVTFWNDAAERMYGWTALQALGRPVAELLETELAEEGIDAIIGGIRETGVFTGETRQRTRDGRDLWVELTGRAVRDASGRLAGLVLVGRDVTDRLEAEAARARAESELRRAGRLDALGQLAAGVAHDFNNLLTAIQGYAELLGAGLEGETQRRDLGEIVSAAERGAALTRQLLAFARCEPPSREPVDAVELVTRLEPLLRQTLGDRVELRLIHAARVPAVLADRGQLERVLLNLAVNARDAMPGGGRLTVSVDTLGGSVRIEVRDTGAGMSAETAAYAFEPFFTTKEPGRGTGLGLATVWGIVHEAGGTIELHSREGAGTTVTVLLPACG